MKRIFIVFIIISASNIYAKSISQKTKLMHKENKTLKKDSEVLDKKPKSLFLLKKSAVNNDVAEPTINLYEKQVTTVLMDERLN